MKNHWLNNKKYTDPVIKQYNYFINNCRWYISKQLNYRWYISKQLKSNSDNILYLHKDGCWCSTTTNNKNEFNEFTGYYDTKEEAEAVLANYLFFLT